MIDPKTLKSGDVFKWNSNGYPNYRVVSCVKPDKVEYYHCRNADGSGMIDEANQLDFTSIDYYMWEKAEIVKRAEPEKSIGVDPRALKVGDVIEWDALDGPCSQKITYTVTKEANDLFVYLTSNRYLSVPAYVSDKEFWSHCELIKKADGPCSLDEVSEELKRCAEIEANTPIAIPPKYPYRADLFPPRAFLKICEVLKDGSEKYGDENAYTIGREDHENHAITHYFKHKTGEATGEDDLAHCVTRLLFALELKLREGDNAKA